MTRTRSSEEDAHEINNYSLGQVLLQVLVDIAEELCSS